MQLYLDDVEVVALGLVEGWSWFSSRSMSYFLFYYTFSVLENFNKAAGGSLDQNYAYLQRIWKDRE